MKRMAHDQWLSFTDLMASAVAIVMIMFVLSVTMAKVEKEAAARARTDEVLVALKEIGGEITVQHLEGMVRVDLREQTIVLEDATFESASACLDPRATRNLGHWSERIKTLLKDHGDLEIFIEGHTDRKPLTRAMNRCGAFDDNYTLSTVRARNARNVFVAAWPSTLQERVSLAGFGPSHPVPGLGPDDARQRRVAIRLVNGSAKP